MIIKLSEWCTKQVDEQHICVVPFVAVVSQGFKVGLFVRISKN
jgi:hypothetical protein